MCTHTFTTFELTELEYKKATDASDHHIRNKFDTLTRELNNTINDIESTVTAKLKELVKKHGKNSS